MMMTMVKLGTRVEHEEGVFLPKRASTAGYPKNPEKLVNYELCLKVHTAVNGMAPNYLSELCRSNAEDVARSWLRSAAHGDLPVPRFSTSFGDRAFAVAGLASWPLSVQSSTSLQTFKTQLKTYFHLSCYVELLLLPPILSTSYSISDGYGRL